MKLTPDGVAYMLLLLKLSDAELLAEMRRVRQFDPDVNHAAIIHQDLKRREGANR